MPIPASHPSSSLLARVQRWLGLDDADDDSECPCAVAARIERAGLEARAKQKAEKDAARLGKAPASVASGVSGRSDSDQVANDGASSAQAYSTSDFAESSSSSCSIAAARRVMAAQRTAQDVIQRASTMASSSASRADEGKIDRAATYAMGGFFHSGFLADTFVYLPEVWLGADGEH